MIIAIPKRAASEAQDHLHGNDEQRQSVPNLTVRRKVPQGSARRKAQVVAAPTFFWDNVEVQMVVRLGEFTIIYYGLWMFMVDIYIEHYFWLVVT